ncbi:MAG: cupin domain-containing protein [Nitrospira sp.]|nr:cupin domain-containing protein [Nitrospira sp.]
MSETKLPEELEEQAILHALGVLDPEDEQVFTVRLKGESDLLRETTQAYQATLGALTGALAPVRPQATLRERLLDRIAVEEAREAKQFERTADVLALNTVPVKPRDSLRERLLSRIEEPSDVQLHLEHQASVTGHTSVRQGEGAANESEARPRHDVDSLATWLASCRTALSNFLRTLLIRSMTSEPVRYWKAKLMFQRPTKGLTYIRASEGIWRGIAPGVTAKVLSFDPVSRRVTTLLRFAPGTSYAPHRHSTVEELFVLEGGCSIAGRAMTVGDYHRAEAGTVHHDTSTDDGCLLLVISSPQNEMLR